MNDFTIDRQNKTFVFDDGEVLPIPKDKVNEVLRTKTGKQTAEKAATQWKEESKTPFTDVATTTTNWIKENLLGNFGETAGNYIGSAIGAFKTGEGQEGLDYSDRILDTFYAKQEERKKHLAAQKQRNPIAAGIGQGIGIVGELGLLGRLPAKAALPIMGAAHSETSFLEPGEKSQELVKEGITGIVLDKFFGGLGKIAGQRKIQRTAKDLIVETEAKNAAEIKLANAATEADKFRYANEITARDAEILRLEGVQQAENEAFQQNSNASTEKVANSLGKHSISNEAVGVEDFIAKSIDTSAHAASSEGNYVSKFLRTIFKGDKSGKLTGDTLKRGVQALDKTIINSEGAVKQLLTDYKTVLNQSLPDRLASSYVFEKWAPKLVIGTPQLEQKLGQIINSSGEIGETLTQRLGKGYIDNFNNAVNLQIQDVLSKFKGNLHQIDPALLRQEITEAISAIPEYQKMMARVETMFPQLPIEVAAKSIPQYGVLKTSLERYPEILAERIAKNAEKYASDIAIDLSTKGGISQKALQKAPISPNVVPQPPPVVPIQVTQANLQTVPTIPQPQGVYGRLAQGLEAFRNIGTKQAMGAVKSGGNLGILAHVAGIPVKKAVLGSAAIAGGMRALTSPSAAGQVLRAGLEQGSRAAIVIDQMAQKYPSYHDGVLEDPQERRSLTKEIENNNDMTLEEKAIYQSNVNRGKPLQNRL